MLAVGLTGGIGSGKSTVADCFAALGVPLIDADVIAREVVAAGTAGLASVVEAFGREIVDDTGALDRRRLRERVFADDTARRQLEAILHPLIRAEMRRQVADCTHPYCIVVVPLLLESGQRDLVQRVLVVDVPEEVQVARTCTRDHVSEAQVRAIIAAQIPRDDRLARADDVITNDRDDAHLRREVARLHARYLKLAQANP